MPSTTPIAADPTQSAGPEPSRTKRIGLLAGPLVAIGIYLFLTLAQADLSPAGRGVAAVAGLMAVWWMTEALPFAATALLPLLLFPLLGINDFDAVAGAYANDTIFLFLGRVL